MRRQSTILLKICFFLLIVTSISFSSQAQIGLYCYFHSAGDVEWSPDGESLAVMTTQAVLIYDADMNLLRTIEARRVINDFTSATGLVWSPDSQWMILPDHTTPEIASQGYNGWTIANALTGELRDIIPPFAISEGGLIEELVWSPDNRFIFALRYESPFGLPAPYTSIIKVAGVFDGGFSPFAQKFDDTHFSNLQWNEDSISINQDGLRLFFDTSLEPVLESTKLHPSWWVDNKSGTFEAAQPDLNNFLIREPGGETQGFLVPPHVDNGGDPILIGVIDEIIWLSDDIRLIGTYPRHTDNNFTEHDIRRLLQGIIVNARTATLENQFLLEAEADIDGYSVSTRGDRIALYHSDVQLELWNPLTEERLSSVEIAPLTNMDDC